MRLPTGFCSRSPSPSPLDATGRTFLVSAPSLSKKSRRSERIAPRSQATPQL
jgi:hypothetical protein